MGNRWTSLHDNRDTQETCKYKTRWGRGLETQLCGAHWGESVCLVSQVDPRNGREGKQTSVSLSLPLETDELIDQHSRQCTGVQKNPEAFQGRKGRAIMVLVRSGA